MSISTGGFAALLAVVSFALASCGGDDANTTAQQAAGAPAATATATETTTATATTTPQRSSPSKTTSATNAAATGGDQTTEPSTRAPVSAKDSGVCPGVELGLREGDIESTFARITTAKGVSCEAAAAIVVQWGQQAIGVDRATVPLGWDCQKGGTVCTSGSKRVAFKLIPPQQ